MPRYISAVCSSTGVHGHSSRVLPAAQCSFVRKATWNRSCVAGNDLEFGRSGDRIAAIQIPPYYALELVPIFTNTQGDPRRNKYAQILDTNRKPIPSLYIARELGSIWEWHYQGAGDFSKCIAFGRIAGEHAAAEKPWL